MEDIILGFIILVYFVSGYFAVGRFSRFLNEINRGRYRQPPAE